MDIKAEVKHHFPALYEPGLVSSIVEHAFIKKVDAGTTLITVSQYIKYVPLILSGSLKVMREDEDAKEILLYYLQAGDSCAMSFTCCMREERSSIHAIAEDETTLIMVPVHLMEEWMTKYKSWRNFILQSYADRMEELLKALDAIAFHSMDRRLYKYLQDRAEALQKETFSITHQEIADELNASREAVSRLLKKLENMGKVELGRNKITLLVAKNNS